MKKLALALIACLGVSEPVRAEIIDIVPEKLDGLPVDLLSGIQFAQNDHGFGRDELYLDLLRPVSETPTPVVVFVLGSGWRATERERVLPQLTFLAEAGFAVATIDYRGRGEAVFPEPEMDVKAAVRYLRANAARLNIDPDRVALFGNSAGGHLALMAALTDDDAYPDTRAPEVPATVGAVAALYPGLFTGGAESSVPNSLNMHLGFDARDPANAEKLAEAMPAAHIDANDPPVLLIHGTADVVVPIAESVGLEESLAAGGVDVTMLRVDGLGHSIEDMMKTRQVQETLVDFLSRSLPTN